MLVLGLCGVASAQPLPRTADKAEADRLFEEGRALLVAGNRAEACKKFDLSIRKDPRAVGTMLNLALCREETGQVASALHLYAEARDRARDQNLMEHKEAAERKIAMLSPRVPHLTISGAPANARVLVDDVVIDHEGLLDVTVDPGTHTIVVTAPGKLPYETKLEVKDSERRTVTIGELQGQTVVVAGATNRRKLWGKITTASGAALTLAGIGLAFYARSYYWSQFPSASRDGLPARDAAHDCWTAPDGASVARRCNQAGSASIDTARTLGHASTAVTIVGLVAVAGGVALWLTAPDSEAQPRVGVAATSEGGSVVISGAF